MKTLTVSVKGTIYDSRTGMPLREERGNDEPANHSAKNVHVQLQKSKTLNRKYVHREQIQPTHTPAPADKSPIAISVHKKVTAPRSTVRAQNVARFAKPIPGSAKTTRVMSDIAPVKHQLVERAQHHMLVKQQPARMHKPSDMIKNEAIAKAMAAAPSKTSKKDVNVQKQRSKLSRFFSIAGASLAVLLLGAYLTYLNMPALSTRIAAAQAGIAASYPSYQPSGYSVNGPVAYRQGSVTMKFVANAGPQNFTLSQAQTDWDSSAVLDSYVTPEVGTNYATTTANGLTIYTYGDNAVWVNNGILYTINGSANLSNDQIQHLATSL